MSNRHATVTLGEIPDLVAEARQQGRQVVEVDAEEAVSVYVYVDELRARNQLLGLQFAAVSDALSRVSKLAHDTQQATEGETVPSQVLTPSQVLDAITSNPAPSGTESVEGGL